MIRSGSIMNGWNRLVPSSVFNWLSVEKERGREKEMCFVMLRHVRGQEKESSEIAHEVDDLASGLFYYRDWTSTNIPIVPEGQVYYSGWWFQFPDEGRRFVHFYGGNGSWMENHDAWVHEANMELGRAMPDE